MFPCKCIACSDGYFNYKNKIFHFSLGSQFPNLELDDAETELLIKNLVDFLEIRMKKKLELLSDLPKRREYISIL